jgi:hypothetical protein
MLPEKVKAVGYDSDEYVEKLAIVNKILGSCGLNAKDKDVFLARGVQS